MARTVGDLRLLFEVMAGYDDADVAAAPVALRLPVGGQAQDHSIGYFEQDGRTSVTAETRRRSGTQWGRWQRLASRPRRFVRRIWSRPTCGGSSLGSLGMLLSPMTKGREQDLSPLLRQFLGWVAKEPTHTGHTLPLHLLQRDELRTQFLAQMRVFPSWCVRWRRYRRSGTGGERSWQVEGQEVKYLDAWSTPSGSICSDFRRASFQ